MPILRLRMRGGAYQLFDHLAMNLVDGSAESPSPLPANQSAVPLSAMLEELDHERARPPFER